MWANVCPALADDDAFDPASANRTGLSLTAVYPEMILKITAPVDPVYAGPIPPDSFFQCPPDGRPQDPGLFDGDRIRIDQWVYPGQVQCFVGVDVSQPGQEGLVKQESFKLPVSLVQGSMQPFRREFIRQRLGSKILENRTGIIHQPDPPKLARIGKYECCVICQCQQETVMFAWLVTAKDNQQVSAHAQVNDEMRAGQFDMQEFGSPVDLLDSLSADDLLELRLGWLNQRALPAQIGSQNCLTDQYWTQAADDGLDLW